LLAASLTAAALWLRHSREALRADVETALTQAARLRESGQFPESRKLLEAAQARLGDSGPSDLVDQVNMALADTRLVERLDNARQWLFDNADTGCPLDFTQTEREYTTTLSEAVLVREGEDKEVIAARVRSSSVRGELLAAILDWAAVTNDEPRRAWLLAVACAADPDPERDRLRRPELWRDRAALSRLADEPVPQTTSPELAVALSRRATAANVREPLQLLVEVRRLHPEDYWLNYTAGWLLYLAKRWDEAVVYHRAALALRPRAPAVHYSLGRTLRSQRKFDEAITSYEEALRLDPQSANAHAGLGLALVEKGKPDEAMGHYQEALRINPKHVTAQVNLGARLAAKGQVDEAIRNYEAALRINPNHAGGHYQYGNALRSKHELDKAIDQYQEALRISPRYAAAHNGLGNALSDKGNQEEAIKQYEEAIDIEPRNASFRVNLGKALLGLGRLDPAIGQYKAALVIEPRNSRALDALGSAFLAKGKVDEAIDCLEKALQLDDKNSSARVNLGCVRLFGQGQVVEATALFKRAVADNPKDAIAHFNLGQALLAKGSFTDARREVHHACAFSSSGQRWFDVFHQTRRALQDCDDLSALEGRLPAILHEKDKPASAAESLKLAWLCQSKLLHAAAARFYAEGIAADPKSADDLSAGHRYYAARCAALAAAGWGEDVPKPDQEERARLRRQALEWLRADLAALQKQLASANAEDRLMAQRTLYLLQRDFRFFAVREKEELAKLPDAERMAWEKLWADTEALRVRSRTAR
jgi:tetratricopeptide (TPR) repeat protein